MVEAASSLDALQRVRAAVKAHFGFDGLRPLQEEAIGCVLAGRDALVVLPTGGGKSLCYQAPALVLPGVTLVVSPLISLMQDQVAGLLEDGVPAAALTSALDRDKKRRVESQLERGELKLLYCSPERLVGDGFLARLERWNVARLAIDEAHCISHWGHDFRPEYRMIGELRRARPDLPVIALTATATPRVREDVAAQLGLKDPAILVGGFDRPNLCYRVKPRGDILQQVLEVVARHADRAGIVYVQRRADADDLAARLKERGVRAAAYHAGMDPSARESTQERFLAEELDLVVATVAFGMGIDRSDVRFVVHASLPKGVEQYSQETGRAGRDGDPAECVMYYGGADFHGWKNLIVASAKEALASGVEGAMQDVDDALERLSDMWRFATGATCRHKGLCEHFGQAFAVPPGGCGACDVCLSELAVEPDSRIVAQKILSCVVRCEQRFGAAHVCDVLRGASTERVRRYAHDRLSTFGLLKEHPAPKLRNWIDQLVGHGHLRVTEGEYPVLVLTRSGAEVLKGGLDVLLHAPAAAPSRARRKSLESGSVADAEVELSGADADLFERLRALRRDMARERGVPPYLIFNDKTLREMARLRPGDEAGLLAVKGARPRARLPRRHRRDLRVPAEAERRSESTAALAPPPSARRQCVALPWSNSSWM
jgi:ATP-dependent DNA helicase RecQ